MKIEKLMTRDVLTVAPETPLKDVAALLSSNHISGAPVCAADGSVLGVVSEADILRKEQGIAPDAGRRFAWLFRMYDRELDKVNARTAGDAMTAPALTVRPGEQASAAAHLMLEHRINRLPVVSDGRLVGIVTRADLVRAFHRSDAEIEEQLREEVLRDMLWVLPETLRLVVEDGVVTVEGAVESEATAEAVVYCMRQVPGVVEVHARLRSLAPPDRSAV
jgi:CBS domain-containing protein